MILGFKKTMLVDGKIKPTNFVDKIKNGVKLHTIRQDSSRRWKAGNSIQFATGVRTKYYDKFKEGECKSVQEIEIQYLNYSGADYPIVVIDGFHFYNPIVNIDYGMVDLAINDGFDSIEDFFKWFKEDFKGVLIHWTDMKYDRKYRLLTLNNE